MASHIAHYCYHPGHGYVLFPSEGTIREGWGRATFVSSPLQATGFTEQDVAKARLNSKKWYVVVSVEHARRVPILPEDIEVHDIRVSWAVLEETAPAHAEGA